MKNKAGILIVAIIFVICLILASNLAKNTTIDLNEGKERTGNLVEKEAVLNVSIASFESEVLNSDKRVLVNFYADWCEPCQKIAPIIDEVAGENPDMKFVKINMDDNKELLKTYNITYIPTLIVIENGKELGRLVGYNSKAKIQELLIP